jgi:hypothetical protein
MTKLPIKYIILEGPDCSGKSSLYSSLNKATSFVRNIRDRSYLSTLCYARLYDRPVVEDLRDSLSEELCDANNYFIVLLPPKEVVLNRLRYRGDEYQNEDTILRLHDIFEEETRRIEFLPNVLVIREPLDREELTKICHKRISLYEETSPELFGALLRMWTKLSILDEVQFKVRYELSPDYDDHECMKIEHEEKYYGEIFEKCKQIVDKEVRGDNPYGVPQGLDTRRFFYSSDTCISSIHFLNRNSNLKVICQLRSTDSVKNGSADMRFLCHLSTEISRSYSWNPAKIYLDVGYNSLHVRNDKV